MNFINSLLTSIKPQSDDDAVDRLNYYWTCVLLLIFSLTISAKQYVGQPIQCWVPAWFKSAWEQYAENYCFVQNTYWLPLNEVIPEDYDDRNAREVNYYQWVPFILAIEAVMFYMPCVIWRQMNWQTGIHIRGIIHMAEEVHNLKHDDRSSMVETVCRHMEDAIGLRPVAQKDKKRKLMQLARLSKPPASFVSLLYLGCKVLYLVNVLIQFVLLDWFLKPKYRLWGASVLLDLLNGREWPENGHFPRVTMCDFETRVLGNLHRHTIQCVLMINMFNEKIFLFLWWWFVAVALANLISIVYWSRAIVSKNDGAQFIARFLRASDITDLEDTDDDDLEAFVSWRLGADGVLVLRMMSAHSGDLVTTDIVSSLWKNFRSSRRQRKDSILDGTTTYRQEPHKRMANSCRSADL